MNVKAISILLASMVLLGCSNKSNNPKEELYQGDMWSRFNSSEYDQHLEENDFVIISMNAYWVLGHRRMEEILVGCRLRDRWEDGGVKLLLMDMAEGRESLEEFASMMESRHGLGHVAEPGSQAPWTIIVSSQGGFIFRNTHFTEDEILSILGNQEGSGERGGRKETMKAGSLRDG